MALFRLVINVENTFTLEARVNIWLKGVFLCSLTYTADPLQARSRKCNMGWLMKSSDSREQSDWVQNNVSHNSNHCCTPLGLLKGDWCGETAGHHSWCKSILHWSHTRPWRWCPALATIRSLTFGAHKWHKKTQIPWKLRFSETFGLGPCSA